MPYFSFSLKQNFLIGKNILKDVENIEVNKVYFSKNTTLWKMLNYKENSNFINFIKYEERLKIKNYKSNILFCLPPSIGFGDAIEYGLAIRSIIKSKKFDNIGIAFTGRYKDIFIKYFDCHNVYGDIIESNQFLKYETIFHFTLEIDKLKLQKYVRSDIENEITKYFGIHKNRKKYINKNKKIKSITLFPVSTSPIRSMSAKIVNKITEHYKSEYHINIVLDDSSLISNYLEEKINHKYFKKLNPLTISDLCKIISNTEFGIFIDSGPLHFAKILGIRGSLITTSVSGDILLNDFKTIKEIKNQYYSNYCNSPCGLTNIFNFENKIGCYQSLQISKENLIKKDNFNSLQRGQIKNRYMNFMVNPVGCINNINLDKLVDEINLSLYN